MARELRASRARVLVLDRYEIGEKQTSACCAPTDWIVNLGLEASIKQTFDSMVLHTQGAHVRWRLPYTFSTFDYRECLELLWAQCGDAEFETAKVDGRTGNVVHTDRGDVRAELIVDALGWRRVLGNDTVQPPEATLSRGLEVHPHGSAPGPAAVGRPALRGLRLRLVVPGPRRAADRHRLLRPALPRQGADGPPGDRRGRRQRPLPGQLDPPPLPGAGRGRRVLLRRLRRPLHRDERRGDPHRLVLRDRGRPRAGGGARGRAHARAGARATTRPSRTRTAGSSSGCGSTSAVCAISMDARWTGWHDSRRALA